MAKIPTTKKIGIIQSIKNKIIDKTSDVMSLPARIKANTMMRQSANDVKTLKADRERGGNQPYPNDESNPQFRTQMNAIEVRNRLSRKVK
jgi:hypothetical protein